MARYRFAPNGGAYSDPHGILSTLSKIKETCTRDGKGWSWQAPGKGWTKRYRTTLTFLAHVAVALKRAKPGGLSRLATRVDTLNSTSVDDQARVYLVRKVQEPPKPTYPTSPVYDGMPPTATSFTVGTGVIFCGGPCKDDYANIESATILGQSVKLQKPAMDSFIAAANEVKGIKLSGSWRSCVAQTSYYNSDPNRYAPPNVTAHVRGLAIDVDTGGSQTALHTALSKRGWFQARADEPWHYSYGIKV